MRLEAQDGGRSGFRILVAGVMSRQKLLVIEVGAIAMAAQTTPPHSLVLLAGNCDSAPPKWSHNDSRFCVCIFPGKNIFFISTANFESVFFPYMFRGSAWKTVLLEL